MTTVQTCSGKTSFVFVLFFYCSHQNTIHPSFDIDPVHIKLLKREKIFKALKKYEASFCLCGCVCVCFFFNLVITLFVRKVDLAAKDFYLLSPFAKGSNGWNRTTGLRGLSQTIATEVKNLITHTQVRHAFCSQFAATSHVHPTCVSLNSPSGIQPVRTSWRTSILTAIHLAHTSSSENPSQQQKVTIGR